MQTVFGLLPKQYCEKNIYIFCIARFQLYCNLGCVVASDCIARDGEIVLQYGRLEGLEGIEIVLQYTKCIVT